MNAVCEEVRTRFGDYLAEALTAAERGGLRQHLAGCVECREEACARDALLLFAVPGPPEGEVSSEETAQILAAVRSAIALRSSERRLEGPPERRRWRGMLSAAAVLALVLALPAGPRAPDATIRPAASAPAANRGAANASPFAPVAVPESPSRTSPSDATIYDWNPGGGQPRVVWIVDRSLDI